MSDKSAKVLIVENDPDYSKLVRGIISKVTNPSFAVEQTSTLKEALEKLAQETIDFILLDLHLPDSEGLKTFDKVHRLVPSLPIVILTSLDNQKVAVEAVRRGAQDYLVREHVEVKTIIAVMRYAMERKHAEIELRRAHDQKEQLLSSITSILIGISSEGLITHWNPVAESTFDIKASEVIGRPFVGCGVHWAYEGILASMEECRKQNKPLQLDDLRFRRGDGQIRVLGFTLIPLKSEVEEATDFLLFGADITARRQDEEMKDALVSTVSHEFRTPLTIIKEGVLQVLEGICGETTPEQKETLSLCLDSIERLGRIVEDLLDISRIEAGKIEVRRELFDLVQLVREVCLAFESQARNKNLTLKVEASKDRIETYVDWDKIMQVLTNLLSNALKFTDSGSIRISLLDKGGTVECSVSDAGRGIPKEDLPKVFSKFEQFNREIGPGAKGAGLGLAICRGLVEAHRGRIWIESKHGEGTTVTFSLPKYSPKDLTKEYLNYQIKEATLFKGKPLSLLAFRLDHLENVRRSKGEDVAHDLIISLAQAVKKNLRRTADRAILDGNTVTVVLPETEKKDALGIVSRVQEMLQNDPHHKHYLDLGVRLNCQIASFPEDGNTDQALLSKIQPVSVQENPAG